MFLVLAVIALPTLLYLCRNISDEKLWKFFKITAVTLLILEVVKIIIPLAQTGIFDWGEDLPLWLSSMFIYLLPFVAWGKDRVRKVAIDAIVVIFFFSGILALSMPLILYYYRTFSFFGLHSLIYHWLMIFVAILLFMRGHVKIEFKNVWLVLIPFLGMAVIAIIMNAIFGGDYMFLNDGRFSAFEMFNHLPQPLYIATVLLLHTVMFSVGAILFWGLGKARLKLGIRMSGGGQ